jgi:gliding motility-associated-like protein
MNIKLFSIIIISTFLFIGCGKNDDSLNHPKIFIPTVFSPDNNKINDVFRPVGEDLSKVKGFKMIITDENGHELFTTDNFILGWNGLKSNGKPFPNGFYFYDIWFHYIDKPEERVIGTVEIACAGW